MSTTVRLQATEGGRSAGPRGTFSVTLLEDDPADKDLFVRQLRLARLASRAEVRVFTNLTDLLSSPGRLHSDVLFCDLTLPDGCDLEVLSAVSAHTDAPVIILTGRNDPALAELALRHGAQDYLVKGHFDAEDLARTMRHAMARSAAESENRRMTSELLHLNRELDQFAGVVAHDLRAPIRTARLFADRLVAETTSGADSPPVAEALDRSLEQMERRIEHLLTMASMRDRSIEPVSAPLSSIVDDVTTDLQEDITLAGASVRCDQDGQVVADPALVRDLLRSLVANSLQARSPDRAPVVVISLSAEQTATELTVTDNGIGVAPRHHERIFGLFERLDGPSSAESMGFGLALCRQIVQLHHGSISMEQPIDEIGALVRIILPSAELP